MDKGNICLIRHGETDWNAIGRFQGREDIPLNAAGIKQIQEASESFEGETWHEIISSPLSRAKMSAEIIRQKIALANIHEESDFMERDLGEISGMTKEEAKKTFPGGNCDGMEGIQLLQERTMGALTKWAQIFAGKNIIIVTHGAVINCILTFLSDGKIEMGKAIPTNGQITLLEKCGAKMEIVFYNAEKRLISFSRN
ncbi:MAG: histidine phosphatase family protein [Treponema sp.]|nr:histidine phosphatase family protein [Treponema sp.]